MLDREVYRDYLGSTIVAARSSLPKAAWRCPSWAPSSGRSVLRKETASPRSSNPEILQTELGAPSMATTGRMHEKPNEPMKRFEIRVGKVPEIDAVTPQER